MLVRSLRKRMVRTKCIVHHTPKMQAKAVRAESATVVPNDIVCCLLSFLPICDRPSLGRVCKQWRRCGAQTASWPTVIDLTQCPYVPMAVLRHQMRPIVLHTRTIFTLSFVAQTSRLTSLHTSVEDDVAWLQLSRCSLPSLTRLNIAVENRPLSPPPPWSPLRQVTDLSVRLSLGSAFSFLAGFPHLEKLSLHRIGDFLDMYDIPQDLVLPKVKQLSFTAYTWEMRYNKGLARIMPNVEELTVETGPLPYAPVPYLWHFDKLVRFHLAGNVDHCSLASILGGCLVPSLRTLHIGVGNDKKKKFVSIGDAEWGRLALLTPNLTSLTVAGDRLRDLSLEELEVVVKGRRLQHLDICGIHIKLLLPLVRFLGQLDRSSLRQVVLLQQNPELSQATVVSFVRREFPNIVRIE